MRIEYIYLYPIRPIENSHELLLASSIGMTWIQIDFLALRRRDLYYLNTPMKYPIESSWGNTLSIKNFTKEKKNKKKLYPISLTNYEIGKWMEVIVNCEINTQVNWLICNANKKKWEIPNSMNKNNKYYNTVVVFSMKQFRCLEQWKYQKIQQCVSQSVEGRQSSSCSLTILKIWLCCENEGKHRLALCVLHSWLYLIDSIY